MRTCIDMFLLEFGLLQCVSTIWYFVSLVKSYFCFCKKYIYIYALWKCSPWCKIVHIPKFLTTCTKLYVQRTMLSYLCFVYIMYSFLSILVILDQWTVSNNAEESACNKLSCSICLFEYYFLSVSLFHWKNIWYKMKIVLYKKELKLRNLN